MIGWTIFPKNHFNKQDRGKQIYTAEEFGSVRTSFANLLNFNFDSLYDGLISKDCD